LEEGKKKQRADFQQQEKEYQIKFERANNLIKELEQRAKNAEETVCLISSNPLEFLSSVLFSYPPSHSVCHAIMFVLGDRIAEGV
jgi:hypothetical protein